MENLMIKIIYKLTFLNYAFECLQVMVGWEPIPIVQQFLQHLCPPYKNMDIKKKKNICLTKIVSVIKEKKLICVFLYSYRESLMMKC